MLPGDINGYGGGAFWQQVFAEGIGLEIGESRRQSWQGN